MGVGKRTENRQNIKVDKATVLRLQALALLEERSMAATLSRIIDDAFVATDQRT